MSHAVQNQISILSAGCSTATGESVAEFVSSLHSGLDALIAVETAKWAVPPKPGFEPRAFRWPNEDRKTIRSLLGKKLIQVFNEAILEIDFQKLKKDRLGVILASTKGFTEDFIWDNQSDLSVDPLTPLLDDFIQNAKLTPRRKICVSNACASSLAALSVAQKWLQADRVDHVVVLACDAIDSFVLHGFHHLRVLSPDRTRPFSETRSGFHLGDAAACVVLSRKVESPYKLIDARIDSEGHAATRPSHSGESLLRAVSELRTIKKAPPELIIAHGTGTQANDVTEERVFTALFGSQDRKPLITGTKWSIGHTLGAAGLLDIVAATEVLQSQSVFPIRTTDASDPAFSSQYFTRNSSEPQIPKVTRVLVTSLGFGGVHAAALVGLA